jgi:hypothetical protein
LLSCDHKDIVVEVVADDDDDDAPVDAPDDDDETITVVSVDMQNKRKEGLVQQKK